MHAVAEIRLTELEAHLAGLLEREDPQAYLATVYLQANRDLNAAIEAGQFQHPEKVAKMAHCFIGNYLESQSRSTSFKAWQISFLAAASPKTTFLQHLFLGLNVLFRVELPRSLHAAFDEAELKAFEDDFLHMNKVLERQYERVWKWVVASYRLETLEKDLLESPLGLPAQMMVGFGFPEPLKVVESLWLDLQKSLGKHTRTQSFQAARDMYDGHRQVLMRIDEEAYAFGMKMYHPPVVLKEVLQWLRKREPQAVTQVCAFFT